MTFGVLLFCTDIIDAPPKEGLKPLVRIFFKDRLSFSYISLQLSKELLYRVKVWIIRGEI